MGSLGKKLSSNKSNDQGAHARIIEVWKQLGRPDVGAKELETIERALRDECTEDDPLTAAVIARILVDEGAGLRHPEVLEFDARQRAKQIQIHARPFLEIQALLIDQPLDLKQAADLLEKLEKLRNQFEADEGNPQLLGQLRSIAIDARKTAQLLSKKRASESDRAEQLEIAEWFAVWIKTPNLFADWIELRRRSTEFREKFASEKSRHREK